MLQVFSQECENLLNHLHEWGLDTFALVGSWVVRVGIDGCNRMKYREDDHSPLYLCVL